jgi:hypothetical protein
MFLNISSINILDAVKINKRIGMYEPPNPSLTPDSPPTNESFTIGRKPVSPLGSYVKSRFPDLNSYAFPEFDEAQTKLSFNRKAPPSMSLPLTPANEFPDMISKRMGEIERLATFIIE